MNRENLMKNNSKTQSVFLNQELIQKQVYYKNKSQQQFEFTTQQPQQQNNKCSLKRKFDQI